MWVREWERTYGCERQREENRWNWRKKGNKCTDGKNTSAHHEIIISLEYFLIFTLSLSLSLSSYLFELSGEGGAGVIFELTEAWRKSEKRWGEKELLSVGVNFLLKWRSTQNASEYCKPTFTLCDDVRWRRTSFYMYLKGPKRWTVEILIMVLFPRFITAYYTE